MKQIIDTGVKGYLKWLKQDQPNLYKTVAPMIAQRIPDAFSNYEQSSAQAQLMGLGQDATDGAASTPFYVGISPYSGATAVTDFTGSSSASAAPDVSDAADSGAASSSVASAIGAIVNGVAQLQLQKAQLNTYQQLNQAQLQRVTAGLQPLTTSSNSLGIPLISGLGTGAAVGGTGLLIGLAVLAGLALLAR